MYIDFKNNIMEEEKLCDVCNSNKIKYTCPRCSIKSCSLDCVKLHKSELKCNGEREIAAYVPLSKYDNLDLLSDYRFLEDIDRTIDTCRRNPQKRYTRFQQPLPTHLYRLKAAALKRKITIQFLPQHFTRRRENTTKLDYETQLITWKVDLIFRQGECIKISETCSEHQKIASVLNKYLNPVECPEKYKSYLKFYHAAGVTDCDILLEAERVKNKNAFFLVDVSNTILEAIENKQIIEYPVFHVIRKAYRHEYNILDDEKCVQAPFEVIHGRNSGFFGDFTPVSFYSSLKAEKKKVDVGHEAMKTISKSAKLLRNMEDCDGYEEDAGTEIPKRNPAWKKRNKLFIRHYDRININKHN